MLAANADVLSRNAFDSEDVSLALNFTPAAASSRLFGSIPKDVFAILGTEPVTTNLHHDGVTPDAYEVHPARWWFVWTCVRVHSSDCVLAGLRVPQILLSTVVNQCGSQRKSVCVQCGGVQLPHLRHTVASREAAV